MKGEAVFLGLWIVNGSSSRDFLVSKKSKSLSHRFVGDEVGELRGVTAIIGSFPFLDDKIFFSGVDDEEEIGMGRDPTEKSLS